MARNIDTAWKEVADIQQAGLDAALAAQSKARKPKPFKLAPAAKDATANGLQSHPHNSNGNEAAPAALPDQDAASGPWTVQAGEGPAAAAGAGQAGEAPVEAQDNGHLASEENQAANKQVPGSVHMTTSSMSKVQVCLLTPVCCAEIYCIVAPDMSQRLHRT